jgi:hypothetical protein
LHLWQHPRCVAIVHFATRTSVVKKPNCNVALRCNKSTFATTWWTTLQYPNATRAFASDGPRNNLVAIVSIATKYGILQHILCVAFGGNLVVYLGPDLSIPTTHGIQTSNRIFRTSTVCPCPPPYPCSICRAQATGGEASTDKPSPPRRSRGPSTFKKVSLRSINFENAFLGP